MGGEWQILPLSDCATWYSGGTPRKSNADFWGGDIPWISAKSLNNFFISDSEDKVTQAAIGNGTKLVPENTILFVVRGMSLKTEFRMGITTRPVSFNQDLKALVAADGIDHDFLAYAIKAKTTEILCLVEEAGHGTGVLPTPLIQALEICVPSLPEQQRIAGLFRAIDDKIELNRRMNATLEAMAQALFKSWFVDFDPVIDNALAAGNPIPEPLRARAEMRAALGDKRKPLPEAIQKQFPSRFVFSEAMGWIPEGWEVTLLESITAEIRRGISPKYVEEGGVRVINQKCIRDHSINYALARRNDETKRKIDGRELIVGDVLVNSTGVGTLGRIAQVFNLDETTVVDSHVTVVRSNVDKYMPYTFGRMLLSLERTIEAMGEGSTGQTELSRANLQAIPVLVPPLGCQAWAEKTFMDSAQKIVANSVENEALIKLRDTLLPKLLSGQLRIPDAEKLVAETV